MDAIADTGSGPTTMVEIKSKFELEFRRISVPRSEVERLSLEAFYRLVTEAHCLPSAAYVRISYQNPQSMRLTSLESAEELVAALRGAAPLLRLFVSRLRGVDVEVSGSEEESEDSDKCNREGGKEEGGRGTKGGMGGGRDITGEVRASNSTVSGERVKAVGRNKQNETPALCKGVSINRVHGDSPQCLLDGFHVKLLTETQSTENRSSLKARATVLENSRGINGVDTNERAQRCGEGARSLSGGEGGGDSDGMPEHPLVTLFREREHQQLERGCRTAEEGERLGEKGHMDRDRCGTLVDDMNRLSLSNNIETKNTQEPLHLEESFPFVIEIYGFDPSLRTRDILQEFKGYERSEFCIKWVDDTHALGIFASERQAWLAAGAVYNGFTTRMVRDGTRESIALAEKLAKELRPQGPGEGDGRPKTTAMVARRMVSSALGIRIKLSPEQKEKEMRELKDVRERRCCNKVKC